jgi:hypothetical protein
MAKRKPNILSQPANKRTAARMRVFLEVYEQTGRLTEAARIAGVSRRTHYRKLEDPVYRKAFAEAEQGAVDALEAEAIRRGRDGVKKPILYKGQPVRQGPRILYLTEYSDQLLIMLLKRFRPALYREHVTAERTGSTEIVERMRAARKRLIEMRAQDAIEVAAG